MNNKIFISRCETILTTMRAGNHQTITVNDVAKWLETTNPAAYQVMYRMNKTYHILEKNKDLDSYKLTDVCSNSLKSTMQTKDLVAAVKYVVDWMINKQHKPVVKETILVNGRKFTKLESSRELDAETQQAAEYLLKLCKANSDLRAENELMKEEIERLKKYEDYYNRIQSTRLG